MQVWELAWCDLDSVDAIAVFTSSARAKVFSDLPPGLTWKPSARQEEEVALHDDGYYRISAIELVSADTWTIEGRVEVSAFESPTNPPLYGVYAEDDPNEALVQCLNDILRPLEWQRVRVTVEVLDE